MNRVTRGVLGVVSVAAVVAAVLLYVASRPEPSRAEGPGVHFQNLDIDDALSAAREAGQRVLLRFEAEWCSSCRTLDAEVLSVRRGGELTADMVAVSFDFDDEANRPLIERYVVLGLPTTLVLTPDGTQVGRIMGYEGADAWVAELRAAKVADDPVPALRAALEASPSEPAAAVRLGAALLVRGSPGEGEALLERALWLEGGADDAGAAAKAEALFLLGRYYHRVRRDPRTARHLWRELAARFPDSDWAAGAWSWYARAEAEIDRPEVGLAALRARVQQNPEHIGAVAGWAEFVVTHELDAERDGALAALRRVVSQASDEDRAELQELATKLRDDTSPAAD